MLSSYLNPPVVKKYKSIADFIVSGLQNTYVGLTTDAAGNIYGATNDGFIRKIVLSNQIGIPCGPDGFYQVLSEEVVLDLYSGSIPDYNNGDEPYVISPNTVIDLCVDRNLSGSLQGVAFYVLFSDNTIGWLCKQDDGSTVGTSIFGPQEMPTRFGAITTNNDSTILYLTSFADVTVYSADPYTDVTIPGIGFFPLAPTLLYSAPVSYDNCLASDIGYNNANGLLYVVLFDMYQTPNGPSYILSLTTTGALVQIVTNTSIMRYPVCIVVDNSGNLIVSGQNYDGTGSALSVPANFIGVQSAYSTPITTTGGVAHFYAMTAGVNGKTYILDTANNVIVQLVPA